MASATATEKYPMLCIPRAMLFHKAEYVEKALNIAVDAPRSTPFVKNIESKQTKDKDGREFNVMFVTLNQDFPENASTALIYKTLEEKGVVNISTGSKGYFWKVKLYVKNLKAQFAPEKPAREGPRIMTDEDDEAFRVWREKRAAAKAAATKGVWEDGEIPAPDVEEKF